MQIKKEVIKISKSRAMYDIDRSWQDVFCNTLNVLGFTNYAELDDNNNAIFNEEVNGYICGDYIVRPYKNNCNLPNFEHTPSGFKMSWHKYPLRSARANQNLSFIEFMKVLGWERE